MLPALEEEGSQTVRHRERVIVPQSTLRTHIYLRRSDGPREITPMRAAGANQRPAPTGSQAGARPSSEHRDYADTSRTGSAVTSVDVLHIGIIRRSA